MNTNTDTATFLTGGFMSILINHINAHGSWDDAEVCTEIAHFINMLPKTVYWASVLGDFIEEHGESVDESYLGRDEYGEKQYYIHNPETNWNERIRKELVALGYYRRQEVEV